ncbi:MAG: 50S ribosomal protein L22 [Candidatus Brocadiia bacterium]
MEQKKFSAHLKFIRIAPQKVRLVVNLVRGMNCNEALAVLEYTPKRGAYFISRLLKSALANVNHHNMEHNADYDVESMIISEIQVNDGPRFKRWRAGPMGRGMPILHRMCHISLSVSLPKSAEEEIEPVPTASVEPVSVPAVETKSEKKAEN